MKCPKCRSEYLVIRQKTGIEWIVLHFTELRKYHCVECGHSFRAKDRRRVPRPEGKIYTVSPEHLRRATAREEKTESSTNA